VAPHFKTCFILPVLAFYDRISPLKRRDAMESFIRLLPIAYLDPGSGSYILQIIIAFLVGGLCTTKLFWNKIKAFFKNLFSGKEKSEKLGK